jgi:hypothetical protein
MRILLLITMFIVAGCAPKNLVRMGDEINPTLEGAIVFKMYGERGYGRYEPEDMLQVFLRKEDSQQFKFTTSSNEDYSVTRLPPGTWYFSAAVANHIAMPRGPFQSNKYSESDPLPLTKFTVKAGEVIYVGDILLSKIRRNQSINGRTGGLSYRIVDNEKAAQADADKYLFSKIDGYQPLKKALLEVAK